MRRGLDSTIIIRRSATSAEPTRPARRVIDGSELSEAEMMAFFDAPGIPCEVLSVEQSKKAAGEWEIDSVRESMSEPGEEESGPVEIYHPHDEEPERLPGEKEDLERIARMPVRRRLGSSDWHY